MKTGRRYLYTVYRNSDDALLAFDMTAKECCEVLGIKLNTFYIYQSDRKSPYTIIKSNPKDVEADMMA